MFPYYPWCIDPDPNSYYLALPSTSPKISFPYDFSIPFAIP